MIDYYEKELTRLFKERGNPEEHKNSYYKLGYKESFEDICLYYNCYKQGLLRQYIIINELAPAISVIYNGDVDSIIEGIKNEEDYPETEAINIYGEIKDVLSLHKLKHAFPDKEILIIFDREMSFIDEAIETRYMIDYYASIVNDSTLTPLEKITVAYDIVKSLQYKEEEKDESPVLSRWLSKIVSSGKIVCVGFAKLFQKILEEVNIKAYNLSYKLIDDTDGHQINIVKVEDPIYDIDDYYLFDATSDSVTQHLYYREEDGTISSEPDEGFRLLDSQSLYSFFLLPLSVYKRGHMGKYETIVGNTISTDEVIGEYEDELDESDLNDIVEDQQIMKDLLTSLNSNNQHVIPLTLEFFICLIYRVRIKEGYSKDMIAQSIQDAIISLFDCDIPLEDIEEFIGENNKQLVL